MPDNEQQITSVVIKRLRDFLNLTTLSNNWVVLLDNPDLGAEDEYRSCTLGTLVNFIISQVDTSSLGIYVLKPIIDVVSVLPITGMTLGDRYLVDKPNDNLHLKVVEWNGVDWDIQVTHVGESIYSYNSNNFVTRVPSGYYLLDPSRRVLETPFTNQESIIINHNLNRYPLVVAIDSSGRELIVQVSHTSRNSCEVSWVGISSGIVICN